MLPLASLAFVLVEKRPFRPTSAKRCTMVSRCDASVAAPGADVRIMCGDCTVRLRKEMVIGQV